MAPRKGRTQPKAGSRGGLATNRRYIHEPLDPAPADVFNTFHISSERYKTLATQYNLQPTEGKSREYPPSGAFVTLHYGRSSKRENSEVGSDSAIDLRPPADDNNSTGARYVANYFGQGEQVAVDQDAAGSQTEDGDIALSKGKGIATSQETFSIQNNQFFEPRVVPPVLTTCQSSTVREPQELIDIELNIRTKTLQSTAEAQTTAPAIHSNNTPNLSSLQPLDQPAFSGAQLTSPDRTRSSPRNSGRENTQGVTTRSAAQRRNRLLEQLAQFPPPDPELPADSSQPSDMAPVKDPSHVPNTIKDVIQHLYDIQSQTHGFIPETQDLLVDKMTDLTQSLSQLQKLTSTTESPNNPVHSIRIAPEIVDYVDDGRNPDIFTRDFVELVQRGNTVINGKQQAFKDFSQIYAKALKGGISGIDKQVDQVMENAGIPESTQSQKRADNEGRNGQ